MQNLRLNGQNDLLVLDEIWLQEKNCDTALKISEMAIYSFSDNQCFLEIFLGKQKETAHKKVVSFFDAAGTHFNVGGFEKDLFKVAYHLKKEAQMKILKYQ